MKNIQKMCSSIRSRLPLLWRALLLMSFLMSLGSAHAAAPLAGTSIGNQAAATYVDGSNVTRTVTSNIVSTIVQQVAALTLQQDLSKTVTAGSQVSYPVTLTNTGNSSDSYALSSSMSGTFTFGSVTFYADANGDGVADNTTPVTNSGVLAPGSVFRFVAVGNVPTTATSGQVDSLIVTATSAFNASVSASVTDTTTVTSNAVINVSKSMSAVSGASPSTGYTVTLAYSNTGNTAATGVTLADALPAGMTYVAGSGRWSVTGATVLTDATGDLQGTAPTINYSVSGNTVTGIVNTVAAGQSGTLTFLVNINAGLTSGQLNNTATFAYNDGVNPIPAANTNTFVFTVNQTASVTFTGQTVASATQGSTISFNNTLTNNGNAVDSFDITVGAGFPAGTTYTLYKADGVTPLVDTNGNGIADTGPVAVGATYTVVLKVTLPAGATGGPYSVAKTATSKFDPTKTAVATDTLTAIAANTVDLTNGGTLGAGAGPEGTPVTTNSTNPGSTTRFTLNVNNGAGSTGDTFNLAASTDVNFSALTLPAGWTVVFRDSAETVITNTGVVAGGASKVVYADVTIPAGQAAIPAPGQNIYFRVLSPSTAAIDRKTDAVIVNTVRSLTLTPNNVGQVIPGGSVVYTHTITNTGNVTENGGTSTIALSLLNTQPGFTSVVYLDANSSNTIDAGDVIINTAVDLGALTAGQSKQLLVKITASSGVGIGVLDTTTLTATTASSINGLAAPGPVSATDGTTVISGSMVLIKEQALDAGCDGTADTAYSTVTISTGAIPGACIRYRLTATNNGNANVLSLVVSDGTPASTVYSATVPATTTLGTITAPAGGSAGTVSATIGTLTPSASVVINFGVKINP